MKIYLDMDGVIVNFVDAALRAHNYENYVPKSWFFYKDLGLTTESFWKKIGGEAFWANLEKYAHSDSLLELVSSIDPEFKILTSPSADSESYSGKFLWVHKHVFKNKLQIPKRLICTSSKEEISSFGRLLIDDSDSNIDSWEKEGGFGILFPQTWNENRDLVKFRLDYVKDKLQEYEDFFNSYKTWH
jgi:hypothetical protein